MPRPTIYAMNIWNFKKQECELVEVDENQVPKVNADDYYPPAQQKDAPDVGKSEASDSESKPAPSG